MILNSHLRSWKFKDFSFIVLLINPLFPTKSTSLRKTFMNLIQIYLMLTSLQIIKWQILKFIWDISS